MLKHIRLFIFIAAITISSTAHLYSQTANYEIAIAGFTIGTQTVVEQQKGDTIAVNIKSQVKISFVFTYEVNYTQYSTYFKGMLIESGVIVYKNGDLEKRTITRWAGDHYEVNLKGKKTTYTDKIHYSGTMLYFHMPLMQDTMYSELGGYATSMKQVKNGVFRNEDEVTGRINEFFYKEGILEKSIIHHPLINFTTSLVVN